MDIIQIKKKFVFHVMELVEIGWIKYYSLISMDCGWGVDGLYYRKINDNQCL